MSPELATLNGKTRTRQLPKAPAADLPSRGRIVLRSRTRKREQLPARKLDALPRRCSVFASVVPSSGECCRGRPSVSSLPCQRCRAAFRPEVPDLFYRNNMKNWAAPALCEERSVVLVMPDDTEPHPYAVAEETAMLAPQRADDFLPVEAGEGSSSVGPYAICVRSEG